ncbi:MAG: diguanylate cyclase, partial [Mobilitalea sp.]
MPKSKEMSSNIQPLLKDSDFIQFLNCSEIAVIYLDNNGSIQYMTPIITSITDISLELDDHSIYHTNFAILYPELIQKISNYIDCVSRNINSISDEKQCKEIEFEMKGQNNNIYQVILHPYLSNSEDIKGFILVFHDITNMKMAENILTVEREKYRLISELTDCSLWEYDIKEKELRMYRKLDGKYQNARSNIPDYYNTIMQLNLIHPEDIHLFTSFCDSMNRGDEFIHCELRAIGESDDYIWMRFQGSLLKDSNGEPQLIMGRTLNIDIELKDRQRLIQKSQLDSLTGLYNKSTTREKVENCFERSVIDHNNEVHSFLIIDIDNFKYANDQWGHLFGDTLLEAFSRELSLQFKDTDVVGRIGGDEFIVLQKGIKDTEQCKVTAKDICDIAKNLSAEIKEKSNITVSIGIALYPDDGTDYDTLYAKADTALYIAKSLGKDQYAFYEENMENLQRKAEFERKRHWYAANIVEKDSPEIESRLLEFAFSIVSETDDLDFAINHALHEIGKFYNLSRISIYQYEMPTLKERVSYEWLNSGINSSGNLIVNDLESIISEYRHLFDQVGYFYFNNLETAQFSTEMKQFYQSIGTKAIIQCAIFDLDKFVGTINFEDCILEREWNKSEIDTLYTITKLISSYIIQLRSKLQLNNEIFYTQAMLNNQKLSNYAIRESTYELLYLSEYTENQFPDVKIGEACYKSIHGRNTPCDPCPLNGLSDDHNLYSIEAYDDTSNTWYSKTASTMIAPDGVKMHLICSSDVTSFIDRVNSRDPMTGLLTLSKFEAEAMKLIAADTEESYVVLYCDFDKFKNINDEWGYSIGNDVLLLYANTVSQFLQPNELFCRISGDIFVMLLSYQNKEQFINRLDEKYIELSHVFQKRFIEISPKIITGLYFMTPEDKVLSVAIDNANTARKTVKGIHKTAYAIYDSLLHMQISREKLIENNMYDALKNNEFIVYLQPKIELSTLSIIGAEALVRWRLPSGQIMSPMEFIPLFEKNGFIDEMDFYVYEKTFEAMRNWMDLGKRMLVVSLNVSLVHLKDSHFLDKLDWLLEKYKIPANLIELEIT